MQAQAFENYEITHRPARQKIIGLRDLPGLRQNFRDKKIVHCHGVFDLFHFGHLMHFKSARQFGDVLVVTITPDRFVNKGPGRPRYTAEQRALILSSLEEVDFVCINDFQTGEEPIRLLRPDFYVKGPDYRNPQNDITGKISTETTAVHECGGKIVFTEDDVLSSTSMINKYFSPWSADQAAAIEKVRAAASVKQIDKMIDDFSQRKVLVVGEPIVDTYVFCTPVGVSSKSPTVSAQYLTQEDYAGGSLAIARHLAALGCQVSLLITHGGEEYFKDILGSVSNENITIHSHRLNEIPTPRKTRYLTQHLTQRMFELINVRSDQWKLCDSQKFISDLKEQSAAHDLTIIADYGHGLFEDKVLKSLSQLDQFVALNVQANSGNIGYNIATKHKRFDYLSIDERECRLATHDRLTPIVELARRFYSEDVKRQTSVTLGTAGSLYFSKDQSEHSCPALFKDVVDTVGAGDAYFAISSLLASSDAASDLIPFIGNCYAGLQSRIVGNKSSVSKIDLLRMVHAILG